MSTIPWDITNFFGTLFGDGATPPTLSNSDQTATYAAAGGQLLADSTVTSADNVYFEVVYVTGLSSGLRQTVVGLIQVGCTLNNQRVFPTAGQAAWVAENQAIFIGGASAATAPVGIINPGDTAMFAFQGSTGLFWVGINGTFTGVPGVSGGSPFTNGGGVTLPVQPFVAISGTPGVVVTLHTDASTYTYTKPTGFNDLPGGLAPAAPNQVNVMCVT